MKLKILIGVLIFLIIINLATIGSFVYLQMKGSNNNQTEIGFNNGGKPPPPEELMLKLNKKQKEQLRDMLNKFRAKAQPYKEQIRILDDETYKLLIKKPVAKNELDTNLKKISNIRLKISQLAVDNMLDAKSILSPAQLELFYNAVIRPMPQSPPPPEQGMRSGEGNSSEMKRPN